MHLPTLTSKQGCWIIAVLWIFIWNLSACGVVVRGNDSQEAPHKAVNQNYKVKVGLYPIATNPGAQLHPHAFILELHCEQHRQRLQNMGYPTSKTFTWSPGQCGDVFLFVHIGDFILKKAYQGANGFPDFLREFSDGHRIYKPVSFDPDKSKELNKLGVEFLKIRFRLEGDVGKVLRFASN